MCKFHDPSIIGSRDTEGGSEEPPPVTDRPKKPSLNRVNTRLRPKQVALLLPIML